MEIVFAYSGTDDPRGPSSPQYVIIRRICIIGD